MISIFYKDYSKKPMVTFPLLNFAPPMAKLSLKPSVKPIKLSTKQKQGRLTGSMKRVKE